ELLDALVDLSELAVEERQVKVEAVGERVDADTALQVLDGGVGLSGLVGGDALVEGLLGLGRQILGVALGLLRLLVVARQEPLYGLEDVGDAEGFLEVVLDAVVLLEVL